MKHFFVLTALLLSLSAHAADAPPPPPPAEAAPTGAPAPEPQVNHFSIMGEPVGYGPTATITRGVAVGYYLTQKDLLSLEYTVGWGINFDESISDTSINTSSIALTYRHFLSRSFYLKGGFLYRTISWSDSRADDGESLTYSRTLDASSTAFEVAVGNRWNIHHFTIGVDWIGYVQPMFATINSQNDPTGAAKTQYLTGGTVELCRLSLGVVF